MSHQSVPARGETLFAICDGIGTASFIWLHPPGDIALRHVHGPHRGKTRDGHWSDPQCFGLFWVCPGRESNQLPTSCVYNCRPGIRACFRLTSHDRAGDFACTESTIRDRIGHAECEQASGWGHRSCDPGSTCGESAGVPPGNASCLCDRRRSPRPRVGSCRSKFPRSHLVLYYEAHEE
jgi:hypothetical protein